MPEIDPITREEKLWSGEDIEPITREEMYIKHIYDKTQTIPSKPITRKEMLLERAGEGGGSDVTIKQLSVTANGTYSEENTAYSPVIVNVPAPPIPDNAYLLKEVEGLPKDIVTFDNGASLPMPSLKVGIEPQQDLHGYDNPWAGGSGKNKLPMTVEEIKALNTNGSWSGNVYTYKDGTFTILTDIDGNVTGIKINGTFSSQPLIFYLGKEDFLSGNTYLLNGAVSNASNFRITISSKGSDFGDGYTYTPTSDDLARNVIIFCDTNSTADNLIFQPMIRLSTETDPTFEPYSNICPISGHTEANVVVSPTTDAEDGQTYNIQFKDGDNPLTVYGGTLDVVSGELTVDRGYVEIGKGAWGNTNENVKSHKITNSVNFTAIYEQFKSVNKSYTTMQEGEALNYNGYVSVYKPTNYATMDDYIDEIGNIKLVYELATPQTYQLTPTQVNSLLGTNNVWADTGDIEELEYFSKEA